MSMNDPYRIRRLKQLRADERLARSYGVWYLTAIASFIRVWRRWVLRDPDQ